MGTFDQPARRPARSATAAAALGFSAIVFDGYDLWRQAIAGDRADLLCPLPDVSDGSGRSRHLTV